VIRAGHRARILFLRIALAERNGTNMRSMKQKRTVGQSWASVNTARPVNLMHGKGNKAQQDWDDAVRVQGCAITGSPGVIHHFLGRATKVKYIGNLGFWALLPLTDELHKERHHIGKTMWEDKYQPEKVLWLRMLQRFQDLPFSDEIYDAILNYSKTGRIA